MLILITLEFFSDPGNARISSFLASKWGQPAGHRFPNYLETGITLDGAFTQPNENLSALSINVGHHWDLSSFLVIVLLIDTNRINPQPTIFGRISSSRIPEIVQKIGTVLCDVQPFAIY